MCYNVILSGINKDERGRFPQLAITFSPSYKMLLIGSGKTSLINLFCNCVLMEISE